MSNSMDNIQSVLATLQSQLTDIKNTQLQQQRTAEAQKKVFETRFNDLERTIAADHDHDDGRQDVVNSNRSSIEDKVSAGESLAFSSIQTDMLQQQYLAIRDTVQKRKLPADLVFTTSKTGLSSQTRDTAHVIANTTKYTETGLTLLDSLLEEARQQNRPTDNLESLSVVLLVQVRYLQEEFSSLVVQGTFGDRTQKLFRSLQKHTSAFTPAVLEQVKTAAQLAAIAEPPFSQRGRQFRGGFRRDFHRGHFNSGFRGRGRGYHRGGFNNNPSSHLPGFQQRDVPFEHQEDDQ